MPNPAFEKGLARYPWWPDWNGECVAIIASGDSTKRARVEQTRDRIRVFAVKKNIELVPWAEVCYGCDEAWWKMNKGLPQYPGLKLSHAKTLQNAYKDVQLVDIDTKRDEMLLEEPLRVGNGGNSGFQALNLALQFGASHIVLVGFDMGGEHWYGRNKPPMNNPDENNFRRWVEGFDRAASSLKKSGVEVVNASLNSRIKCFPKLELEQTLRSWGL